jgi:hypothetical protein
MYLQLLYGSNARGEADALSDVDELWVSDDVSADYSWQDLQRLRSYGSLFLWHLHLEAKVLKADAEGRDRWAAITDRLPRYARAEQDMRAFEHVLGDVKDALHMGDTGIAFEAGVLARTVRHAAILACFIAGKPNFSRYRAVAEAARLLEVDAPRVFPFECLYDAVLRPDEFVCTSSTLLAWVDFGFALVSRMRRVVRGDG